MRKRVVASVSGGSGGAARVPGLFRVLGLSCLLCLFLAAGLAATLPGTAVAAMKRAVLGTVVQPGAIEISTQAGEWRPGTSGAPVIEDSDLRTGTGKTAREAAGEAAGEIAGEISMIALGKQGVIGVREGSHLHVGRHGPDGLPLSLERGGSISFRLPQGSELRFVTKAAIVTGPAPAAAGAGPPAVQGIITQNGHETSIQVVGGSLRVRNRDGGEFVSVAEGQQAIISTPTMAPRIARMTSQTKEKSRRRLLGLGFLGTKTGLIVAGATAAAVGGGVGAAAAAGAFDSGSSSDSNAEASPPPTQGSPFDPE